MQQAGSDFFLQTRIAIPQYFSQSYGAYFKYIVRTCTCAYTYCKCLRDVNVSYVILKYAPYDWLKCNPRLQKKKSQAGRASSRNAVCFSCASLPCYSKALLTTQAQFAISARSSCAAALKCPRNWNFCNTDGCF